MTVKIITTGGTIDKIYFDSKSKFEVGEPQVAEVLKEANIQIAYGITSLMQKDSLEMTDEDRQLIYQTVLADPAQQIIITHGTDTMTVTAAILSDIPHKTIVLTGALSPARFRLTDAVFNIASAFTAVQILPPGVYIAMNGQVAPSNKLRKNAAENRFESVE